MKKSLRRDVGEIVTEILPLCSFFRVFLCFLVPNAQKTVPGTRSDRHSVLCHS